MSIKKDVWSCDNILNILDNMRADEIRKVLIRKMEISPQFLSKIIDKQELKNLLFSLCSEFSKTKCFFKEF